MSQSAESPQVVQEIITSLRKKQPLYRYEPLENGLKLNYSDLNDKTLIAVIGPTGVGKSTLTDEVLRLDSDIRPIGTTTTRERRPSDPIEFKTANEGVTHMSMNQAIIEGVMVNYSVNDTGHVYGTMPEDFHGEHNIGPILSDSIDNLMTAGFKEFSPIFVAARGLVYQQRLEKERLDFPDISKRLVEAMGSITFARMNADASWLSFIDTGNSPESLHSAASDVVRIAHQNTHPVMLLNHRLMLLDEMETAVHAVARQVR